MATYNRAASGMGYTGYPARIFFEMTNFAKGTQTHLELLWILFKWFSHLRAHLPVKMEKDIGGYNKDFAPALIIVDEKIQKAWHLYKPTFEGLDSFDPDEKEFTLFLMSIFVDLDEITAKSKIIDGEKPTEELMKV